jgi:hypothetical protein
MSRWRCASEMHDWYSERQLTVRILEPWPGLSTLQDQQLLAKPKIIYDQQPLWADSGTNHPQQIANIHFPRLLSD